MPRYYYDISGARPFRDDQGTEHPDDEAAWREAVRLIRDVEEQLRPNQAWSLTVREGQRTIFLIEVTTKAIAGPS